MQSIKFLSVLLLVVYASGCGNTPIKDSQSTNEKEAVPVEDETSDEKGFNPCLINSKLSQCVKDEDEDENKD